MGSKKNGAMKLRVTFGDISIGDRTARVGIKIDRNNLSITRVDDTLCGKRISGVLVITNGDDDGQEKLPGMTDLDHEMAGVADVKSYSVTSKHISCGLTFALESIDLAALCHFAKRAGTLTVEGVEAIPDEEAGEEADPFDAEEAAAAGKPRRRRAKPIDAEQDESWRADSIDDALRMLTENLRAKLHEASIDCMGDLADFTRDGKRQITDIPGIGPGNAAKIEEATTFYWQRRKEAAAVAEEVAEATEVPEEAEGED